MMEPVNNEPVNNEPVNQADKQPVTKDIITNTYIEAGGYRLFVRISQFPQPEGAPTIILLHGLAVSTTYMVPAAERLAPYCQVYAPDMAGFGESEKPEHTLTLSEHSAVLGAFLDSLGLERVILLGNSYGCQLAVHYAMNHPQRVEKLILQGPTIDASRRNHLEQFLRLLSDAPLERPSQTLNVLHALYKSGPTRIFRTFFDAMEDQIEKKLPYVDAPTLVVCGTEDPLVPADWAAEVARLLPNGRLVMMQDVAHTINYSAPDEFVEIILPFIFE